MTDEDKEYANFIRSLDIYNIGNLAPYAVSAMFDRLLRIIDRAE